MHAIVLAKDVSSCWRFLAFALREKKAWTVLLWSWCWESVVVHSAFSAYFSFGVIIHLAAKNRALWPAQRGDRKRTMRHLRRPLWGSQPVPRPAGGTPSDLDVLRWAEMGRDGRRGFSSGWCRANSHAVLVPCQDCNSWGEPQMPVWILKRWQLCISRQVRCTCHVTLYDQWDCFEASRRRLGHLAGTCKWVEQAVEWKGRMWRSLGLVKGSSLPSWCN